MTAQALMVVDHVDLQRYVGTWYEIARYPARFEKGCVGSTAEYNLRGDGKIQVINRCREQSFDGRAREIQGTARVVDEQTNAKSKVTFFWPFRGDYWIIDLDENYQWAVIGEPRRKYLWILSRARTLDDSVYQAIVSRLPAKGYDPFRLQRTPQQAPALSR